MVHIGTYVDELLPVAPATLSCSNERFQPLLGTPWMKDCLALELGVATLDEEPDGAVVAELPDWITERPIITMGKSGGGKSKLSEFLAGQFIQRGNSVLVILPKAQDNASLIGECWRAGLPPEDLVIL